MNSTFFASVSAVPACGAEAILKLLVTMPEAGTQHQQLGKADGIKTTDIIDKLINE